MMFGCLVRITSADDEKRSDLVFGLWKALYCVLPLLGITLQTNENNRLK